MSANHHHAMQSSVTVDRFFAPAPHGLINDPLISHAAFRLWCVLHRLAWLHDPPEMERLCTEMRQDDRTPDRRSVYRWLVELESRGWIDWTRTPGKASINRFMVRSERKPVTPESQPVTPESQPVTPESQPVTPESQAPAVHPLSERTREAPNKSKTLKESKIGGGGAALAEKILLDAQLFPSTVKQILAMNLDPPTLIASVAYLQSEQWGPGAIADKIRNTPPEKGHPYERPTASEPPPHASRRRLPSERLGDRPTLPAGLRVAGRKAADRSDG